MITWTPWQKDCCPQIMSWSGAQNISSTLSSYSGIYRGAVALYIMFWSFKCGIRKKIVVQKLCDLLSEEYFWANISRTGIYEDFYTFIPDPPFFSFHRII